ILAVRHDRHPVSLRPVRNQAAFVTRTTAVMLEIPALPIFRDHETDSIRPHAHRRHHFLRSRSRKRSRRPAGKLKLHLDRKLPEVGRGSPKSGRRLLRKGPPRNFLAVARPIVRPRGLLLSILRERLLISAVAHPNWPQHPILHDRRKWLADSIRQGQLFDHRAAPGILKAFERSPSQPHRPLFRRRNAVQNLNYRRQRRAGLIPIKSKSVNCSGRVAHQRPWGYEHPAMERIIWKLPGFQNRIDVLIQPEPALLNSP